MWEGMGDDMEVDPKMAATGGGIVAGAFGWLIARVYKALGHRINEAHATANSAVTLATQVEQRRRDDVKDVHHKLDGHIQRDIEAHGELMSVMREQTNKLSEIHTALVRDLGERPTRAEVQGMIELRQGRRT